MPDSRILVVEDEPTSREIVDFVLSGAGYGVDMAATAAAAVMLLGSTRYGLVIADWLLPDGDGIYIADRALALGSQEGARNLERLNGGPIHLLILIKING
jgi:DNA-binding response OmpR family regulator